MPRHPFLMGDGIPARNALAPTGGPPPSFRLFAGLSTGADFGDIHTTDIGFQVTVTASGYKLDGYWWWVPTGGADTAGANYAFQLFSTTTGLTGTPIAGSAVTGAGTWTAGASNFTALTPSIALTNGTTYVPVITYNGAGSSYGIIAAYWSTGAGSGGITSGPLSAPSTAASLNGRQQAFNEPGTGSFPTTANADYFGLDIQVSTV